MSVTLKRHKKSGKTFENAIVSINATFNNTHVTVSEPGGNVLVWWNGGKAGFKGARESTPYASTLLTEQVLDEATKVYGVKSVTIRVKWIGSGRDNAIRAVVWAGLDVTDIYDDTPVPYNGCKRKKVRRM